MMRHLALKIATKIDAVFALCKFIFANGSLKFSHSTDFAPIIRTVDFPGLIWTAAATSNNSRMNKCLANFL